MVRTFGPPYPEHSDVATHPAPPATTAADDLLLKVTPPRAPRNLVVRARLRDDDYAEVPAVLVQAPAGFGKTSLLSQWRREALAHGQGGRVGVGPTAGRSAASRAGTGAGGAQQRRAAELRPYLARGGAAGRARGGHGLAGGTGAHRLERGADRRRGRPPACRRRARRSPTCCATRRPTCAWWWRRAPMSASASTISSPTASASSSGRHCCASRSTRRSQLARDRLGAQFDHDAAARLHELTEGWPLGVQLAVSVIASGGNAYAPFSAPTAPGDSLRGRLWACCWPTSTRPTSRS